MDINIACTIDERQLARDISRQATRACIAIIGNRFDAGTHDGNKGVAYSAIEAAVDSVMGSDETANFISNFIEANWQPMLEAALLKALNRKAHKIAFTKTKEDLPLTIQGACDD